MDHRLPGRRTSRAAQLQDARLYLCTPARTEQGDLREFLHAAYEGGVDIIQLRDKGIDTNAEIEALEVLAEVAREHGKLFAVNDRADIAALVGADVFHVGQDDLTTAQARELLGPDVLIGLSTHSLSQAREAMQDADLDYFCTGPLWETPTKPGRAATGLELVTETAEMLASATEPAQRDKVWFTIGGVNAQTLPQVQAAAHAAPGAGEFPVRAVVVRPITGAVDPRAAAAELAAVLG
ncbi:MAG TPA: thiamine phosphate synthase [Candidatus Corynebacterium avicola]|uniref:Thiamine-phosphate synthase n=1 Tax=Candidatus Corynebacterium avicola TaxID=2838527 RepID=A0A9D1RU84_9CORY|nr:thiamine phosphate synthase [Candidatus Corynebacterium avicola]